MLISEYFTENKAYNIVKVILTKKMIWELIFERVIITNVNVYTNLSEW